MVLDSLNIESLDHVSGSASISQSIASNPDGPSSLRSQPESESPESDDKDPNAPPKKPSCCSRFCGWISQFFESLSALNPSNLTFNPVDPGNWDEWGIYYCSSRYGRHSKFNLTYFSLAALIIVGQSNFFNLINLMTEHGGFAFILILFLSYTSFGYLTYLLETLMGQYTGRKPIEMIRLMAPVFSGLGVALYMRTIFRAMNVFGTFANCLAHFWDLLFCKGTKTVLLSKLLLQERDEPKFVPFFGLEHPYLTFKSNEEFGLDLLTFILCSFAFWICLVMKLKEFGGGMKVVFRLLLLFLCFWSVAGYLRLNPTIRNENYTDLIKSPLVYLPIKHAFKTQWSQLFSGVAWLRAMVFVMHSLELDTLVHPYLGSKVFFHYRSTRDGIYLVLVSFSWNLVGAVGVLLWLGYVGVTEKEFRALFTELDGLYGMFVVFPMKHIQAEMTQQVEIDAVFFCAVFFLIMGLAALVASVCYMYILTDCAYPESGHPLTKLTCFIYYLIFFGMIFFPVMASANGLRHLIFLNYYGLDSWVGIFLLICFTFAVSWSHGMARVLHDFYNVVHLVGYEVMTHYHQLPALVVILFTGYPFLALIMQAIHRIRLRQGTTDWKHPATLVLGYSLSFAPVFAVIFGAVYHIRQERNNKDKDDNSDLVFEPHRDFYKNKHHICICFKDYQNFDESKLPSKVRRRLPPKQNFLFEQQTQNIR